MRSRPPRSAEQSRGGLVVRPEGRGVPRDSVRLRLGLRGLLLSACGVSSPWGCVAVRFPIVRTFRLCSPRPPGGRGGLSGPL